MLAYDYYHEWDSSMTVEGCAAKPGEDMNTGENHVSPGLFEALKIPVLAGREFTERDAGTPKAIVNQKFARHYFGEGPAVGRHIGMGSDPGTKTDIEIIGVVGDTRYQTMKQDPPCQGLLPLPQERVGRLPDDRVRCFGRMSARPRCFPPLRACSGAAQPEPASLYDENRGDTAEYWGGFRVTTTIRR